MSINPTLPLTHVDTTYIQPTGKIIHVASGQSLQEALDIAQPGDTITLDKGATYVGNFNLSVKSGSEYIVVTSRDFTNQLRVSPETKMACIVGLGAGPAIYTSAVAHHYRFIGLEIKSDVGQYNHGLVRFGSGEETTVEQFPHHLILDRCYVHGDAIAGGKRGVLLSGDYLAVINCHLSDWKGIGQDTQAICGWTGRGPWKIKNNYIEGAGENLMIGGADTHIPDLTPSDIEICGNKFFKPLSWKVGHPDYSGTPWLIKNLLELKHARRVLIFYNTFENCWRHGQVGFAVTFTVRNQSGTNPWATVSDVTFIRNDVFNTANGINMLGYDNESGVPSQYSKRLLIQHNLFRDIGTSNEDGIAFQILYGYQDVKIDHNTAIHTGTTIVAEGESFPRFMFSNNIVQHNLYGIFGSGYGVGNGAIEHYFPGSLIVKNVFKSNESGYESLYPPDNYFPLTNESIGFVDYPHDLHLSESSPYYHGTAENTNIGY